MTFWKGKSVLVTGADGFIGANLCKELLKRGGRVISIERDERPNNTLRLFGIRQEITVVRGDICDHALLSRTLNEFSVSHCFHLAAQTQVGLAQKGPLGTLETNIRGTYMLLEACRTSPSLEGLVVASSDKAYGIHERLPYTEQDELLGLYPYDASKVCTDILTRSYSVSYGLRAGVTRCANVYGPGDMNFARLIPDAIRCGIQGIPLNIRSDGRMERDYMYVDDAVEAYLALAEGLQQDKMVGQALNFGTEQPVSVLEVVERIGKLIDSSKNPVILNNTSSEIPRQYLDSTRARELLGWTAKTSLEQGLTKTANWYSDLYHKNPHIFS